MMVQENLWNESLNETDAGRKQGEFSKYLMDFTRYFLQEDFPKALELSLNWLQREEINESQLNDLLTNFEQLGATEYVLECCRKLIYLKPDSPEYAIRYAENLRLVGKEDEAVAYLEAQTAAHPTAKVFYDHLLKIYTDGSRQAEIERLLAIAEHNGYPELNGKTDSPGLMLQAESEPSPDLAATNPDATSIQRFMNIFEGRENCFARQWVSDNGQTGYSPVNEPLSPGQLQNHLSGNYTLGIYQLDLRNQVKWIAFDIDVDKSALDELRSPSYRTWIEQGYQKVIGQFRAMLSVYQIWANYEFSGQKGYHVWILLEEKISARFAQTFAKNIALNINLEGYPFHIEVYPKQSFVRSGQYGNLLKLPYGIHRVTGLPSYFEAEDGAKLSLAEFMNSVQITDLDRFISALRSIDPGFANTKSTEDDLQSGKPPWEIDKVTSQIPAPVFVLDQDADWLWLKSRCNALAQIEAIVSQSHQLSGEQRKILTHTCGHLEHGPGIVNSILKDCLSVDPAEFLKSRLRGNVVSCQKIRRAMPDILNDQNCNCDFGYSISSYPHPLLHLETREDRHNTVNSINDVLIQNLVLKYIELKRQSHDLPDTLLKTESDLLGLFDEIGLEEISTPLGNLKRSGEAGAYALTLSLKKE